MSIKFTLLKAILYLIGIVKGEKYRYSQEYEDNFKYMDINEKLWWGYKSVVKQIERAEKGKGIEAYFANQNLDFKENDDFTAESTMTLSAGGDLSASEMIFPENTEYLWEDIKDFYFDADIVYGNLESPIVESRPPSGVPGICLTAPDLNISPAMFDRFVYRGRGINFFSTANNHSLDQGEDGLRTTLDFLDKRGYPHVGTARTPEEQDDIPIINKNGINIAFLSYTYCLNGKEPIPGKPYLVNELRLNKPDTDISTIKRHAEIARKKGADIVAALLHWSIEFETYPIQNIIDMGHRIIECGVDVILGGHPHVAQPVERYRYYDEKLQLFKEGLIVYSLGELVSLNLFSKNSRLATLVKLEFSKGHISGKSMVKLTDLKILPIFTSYRVFGRKKTDYRVLNLKRTIDMLEQGDNPHNFNEKEKTELYRLYKLFNDCLLPKDKHGLIP